MSKFLAVAYGKDGFSGDSSFYVEESTFVPATDKSTFEELLAAWIGKQEEDLSLDDFDGDRPIGFWLLTKKNLVTVCQVYTEVHSDSACYQQNRTAKNLAAHLASKFVGTKCPEDVI